VVARAQLVMASSATSGKIMRVSSNAEALVCTVADPGCPGCPDTRRFV